MATLGNRREVVVIVMLESWLSKYSIVYGSRYIMRITQAIQQGLGVNSLPMPGRVCPEKVFEECLVVPQA